MAKDRVKFKTQRVAFDESMTALATGPEHAALVAACRRLAAIIDGLDEFDAAVWREYRLMLSELMTATSGEGDGTIGDLFEEINKRAAAVRDT
jgi:hypothetical protein